MQKSNLLPSSCDWCPLNCGANRLDGETGLCGSNDEIIVSRSALHYWEEPPISGNCGSGTVFFSNCSMKCIYCQNKEISIDGKGRKIGINELSDLFKDLESQGAMNINIVTGTHYRSQIISAIRQSNLNLPIVWNTSGYETIASVSALSGVVDVWLTDFKYADNELCKKYSYNNVNNYVEVALDALATMIDFCGDRKFDIFNEQARMTKGIIVRHLLLPNCLDNSKAVLKLLYENFGNEIKYSIMNQYTPCTDVEGLNVKCSNDDYEKLLDYADTLGIEDYYWQQSGASSKDFIPNFSRQ